MPSILPELKSGLSEFPALFVFSPGFSLLLPAATLRPSCERSIFKPSVSKLRATLRKKAPPKWVWVKIQPPGYGPQVLVLVSIHQGKPFWGYPIFDPQPRMLPLSPRGTSARSGQRERATEHPRGQADVGLGEVGGGAWVKWGGGGGAGGGGSFCVAFNEFARKSSQPQSTGIRTSPMLAHVRNRNAELLRPPSGTVAKGAGAASAGCATSPGGAARAAAGDASAACAAGGGDSPGGVKKRKSLSAPSR